MSVLGNVCPTGKVVFTHSDQVDKYALALGSGETSWNSQKIGAEPDLVAFHI